MDDTDIITLYPLMA